MKSLDQVLKENLKDQEFAEAYQFESIIQEIALKLAKIRKEVGISQKQLADKINTKQQVISRIENGNQNVSLEMLFKLSKALNSDLVVDIHRSS